MDPERARQIYDSIAPYVLELAPDPTVLGPKYLSDMISKCRAFINKVNVVMLQLHREKHELSHDLRIQETAYQLGFDNLLANDERVRRLPSIDDRRATANVFLRDDLQKINDLKAQIQDVEYVEKSIRLRHRELKDTMQEIRLQRSLIKDDIETGSMYGDESKPERREEEDIDASELDKMFEVQAQPEPPKEPLPGQEMSEQITAQPDSEPKTAENPEDSFGDILDRL